jgi:hypothetical protein
MNIALIIVIVLVLYAVVNFAVKARTGSFLITPIWRRDKSGKDASGNADRQQSLKMSRPQPQASAALLPDPLMAGCAAAPGSTTWHTAVSCRPASGARPAVFETWEGIGRRHHCAFSAGIRKVIML